MNPDLAPRQRHVIWREHHTQLRAPALLRIELPHDLGRQRALTQRNRAHEALPQPSPQGFSGIQQCH